MLVSARGCPEGARKVVPECTRGCQRWCQRVPDGVRRCQRMPEGARWYQWVPGGASEYQRVTEGPDWDGRGPRIG